MKAFSAGRSSYLHTHHHRLGKAASKRALGGKPCGPRASTQLRITVQMQQKLVGGNGGSGGGGASAAAAPTQSSSAAAAAVVEDVSAAPTVENGCVYDSKGVMDCMGAFLQKASFVGLALPYANFSFANLTGANLAETKFEGSSICDQHTLFPGIFKFVCSNNVIVKG